MNNPTQYIVIRAKHVRLALVVLLVAAVSVAAISGAGASFSFRFPAASGDGRINVVHHFGGDVFYCVDANSIATNTFFTGVSGGIKLLNMNGEQLFFVPAEIVLAKTAEAQPGGENVLVAQGQGTYGTVSIYVYKMTDGTVHFIFVGVDEHGKTNQVDSIGCQPVNPPANGISSGLCSLKEVDDALFNLDIETFFECYDLACPDIDIFDFPAAPNCFCPQYPTSLACGGIPEEEPRG